MNIQSYFSNLDGAKKAIISWVMMLILLFFQFVVAVAFWFIVPEKSHNSWTGFDDPYLAIYLIYQCIVLFSGFLFTIYLMWSDRNNKKDILGFLFLIFIYSIFFLLLYFYKIIFNINDNNHYGAYDFIFNGKLAYWNINLLWYALTTAEFLFPFASITMAFAGRRFTKWGTTLTALLLAGGYIFLIVRVFLFRI